MMFLKDRFRKNFLYLIYGTKGGYTRIKIILLLLKRPYNANQITKELNLDYKTVQHHLRIMEENNIIVSSKKKYGSVYFTSEMMKMNIDVLNKVLADLGKDK